MDKKSGTKGPRTSVPLEPPQPTKDGNPDLFRTINATEWHELRAKYNLDMDGKPLPREEHLSFTDLPMEGVHAEIEKIKHKETSSEFAFREQSPSSERLHAVRETSDYDSQDALQQSKRALGVGSVIHHYQLEQVLGDGMTGRVYLAQHLKMPMRYAVKVLHPWFTKKHGMLQNFLSSFNQLERLAHPGIVRPFMLDEDPKTGEVFYFMDLLHGQSYISTVAQKHEQKSSFSQEEIMDFLDQVGPTLQYAHENHVYGGNVQPSRIFINERDRKHPLKLLSFGLGASLDRADHSPLQSGPLHAMYYAAPEAQHGGHPLSASSDVFSLGVIVYQLLTGALPIGIARPPSEVSPEWSPAIDEVMSRAMQAEPHKRYGTVEDFLLDFKGAFKPKSNVVSLSLSGDSSPDIPASSFQPVVTPLPRGASARHTPPPPGTQEDDKHPNFGGYQSSTLNPKPMVTPPQGIAYTSGMYRSSAPSSSKVESPLAGNIQNVNSPMSTWPAHDLAITSMAVSPDGKLLASVGEDRSMRIWSTGSWSQMQTCSVTASRMMHLTWSSDSQNVAFVDEQNTVQVWNIQRMRLMHSLAHNTRVHKIAWHPNGHQIYSACENNSIQMWNLRMDRVMGTLEGHSGSIHSLLFEPSFKALVSGSSDHTIKLWSVEEKRLFQSLCTCKSPVFAMALSQTSSVLATGHTDALVQLRDFRSGHLKCSLRGHEGSITALAFGPNDRWLASAATDCTIRLWNTRKSKLIHTIEHHNSPVHSLCLSQDGSWMASACADNRICIWNTSNW